MKSVGVPEQGVGNTSVVSDKPQPTPRAGALGRRPVTAARRRQLLVDALALMEARYAEQDLALSAVARQVACSGRQLQRIFAEVAHSTFRQELAAVRMRHVAELLQTTSLPVKEIARQVGYSSGAQLAKVFRRHHSVAPMAFRRRVSSA